MTPGEAANGVGDRDVAGAAGASVNSCHGNPTLAPAQFFVQGKETRRDCGKVLRTLLQGALPSSFEGGTFSTEFLVFGGGTTLLVSQLIASGGHPSFGFFYLSQKLEQDVFVTGALGLERLHLAGEVFEFLGAPDGTVVEASLFGDELGREVGNARLFVPLPTAEFAQLRFAFGKGSSSEVDGGVIHQTFVDGGDARFDTGQFIIGELERQELGGVRHHPNPSANSIAPVDAAPALKGGGSKIQTFVRRL